MMKQTLKEEIIKLRLDQYNYGRNSEEGKIEDLDPFYIEKCKKRFEELEVPEEMKSLLKKIINEIENKIEPNNCKDICNQIKNIIDLDIFLEYFGCYLLFDYMEEDVNIDETKIKWGNYIKELIQIKNN
jgi:hypothetical protein